MERPTEYITTVAAYAHTWRCADTVFAECGVHCGDDIEVDYPQLVTRDRADATSEELTRTHDAARDAAVYVVRHGAATATFGYRDLTDTGALGAWIRMLHRGGGHGGLEVGVVASRAPLPGHGLREVPAREDDHDAAR